MALSCHYVLLLRRNLQNLTMFLKRTLGFLERRPATLPFSWDMIQSSDIFFLFFYYIWFFNSKLFFSFNPQKIVFRETASTSTAVKDELTAANQLFPSSPAPPPSSHHPRVSHYVGSTFSPFFLSFPSWWHQHHHLPLVSCEEKPSSVATGIHLYLQLR